MADFVPYEAYAKIDRASNPFWKNRGGADVKLSPDRWQALCGHFTELQREHGLEQPLVEIRLDVPVEIGDTIYLPGLYRAA